MMDSMNIVNRRFKNTKRTCFFAKTILVCILCVSSSQAADDGIAFFEQKIRPVLIEHCYECHSAQAKKLKSNLFLDSQAGWEKGGDYGEPTIIPGKPDESLLIRSVQHLEQGLEMPPDKPKLPDTVIADLVTWIKMGAPDPRDNVKVDVKRADKSWWSLQPLKSEMKHSSIDDYIGETLAMQGLEWSVPADPRSLIRRMTYDMHGLPPTPDEVDAFVKAHQLDAKQAAESLVDRLLASTRYGERWGRHWLDVIRFGESNGFERNVIIDDLYPFRDYVIRSINDDKPFNQFIVEHLAGDVVGKNDPQTEIGTAFLVAGPYDDVGNQDIVAQANIRAATVDDMITATGSAFLGLTINCARCHHHKFDPIPTEDYYRVRAAFEGVTHGRRVVATVEERDAHASAIQPLNQELKKFEEMKAKLDDVIEERVKSVLAEKKTTRPKVDPFGTSESFPPVEAKFVKFVILGLTSDHPSKAPRGSGPGGKLTEFQVWSDDAEPRNVALASNGTTAEGAKSVTAEDFPEAYGPQYCIDGMRGEAWFIGKPSVLTLTFSKPERIREITFINTRGDRDTDESKVRGATPCEYEVQVSLDGQIWQTVATDEGREPWTPQHGIAKLRRETVTQAETERLAELDKQIARLKRQIAQIPTLRQAWVGKFNQPSEKTFVHQGGDPMKPLDEIVASSLSVLDQVNPSYVLDSETPESQRRRALAEWITRSDNPLTPRVLANRVWQYHFGTGIVDTPSDFGFLGGQPTHPELLDYLATRLMANDWKLKPLHREILLSKTYLQSSTFRGDAAGKDKAARFLWRFPPRRLSAEEIRDTLLMVAGELQLEPMGGPGFRLYKFTQNNVCTYFPLDVHGPETYRRAVYHQNARASVVDILNDFDLPDISFAAPKRANTTTPLQALTMLNHRFMLDMAKALGKRIGEDSPIETAYRLLFQRSPSPLEHHAATELLTAHGREAFCRALLNANELIYIE
jgi:Protein of unknown function (DUF1553)/Protein of unknown function (DUF1549)/Planctomycete cytochrome C